MMIDEELCKSASNALAFNFFARKSGRKLIASLAASVVGALVMRFEDRGDLSREENDELFDKACDELLRYIAIAKEVNSQLPDEYRKSKV